MSERYFEGGAERVAYDRGSEQFDASFALLVQSFPWAQEPDYYSLTSPIEHTILGEPVITGSIPQSQTQALGGVEYAIGARKFCMQSQRSFLRLYKIFDGEKPAWLPSEAKVLAIGENHEEYGRPFPNLAADFHDLYIQCDPAVMEATFNLATHRGDYETYFGITVHLGQPARIKQYVYDTPTGFSDWDVIFLLQCKRLGRMDLIEG